jgi:hypothetical protein
VQVKIITSKKDQNYDIEIVQKNKNPSQFEPFCEYKENFNIILVSVPSCSSNASSQINKNDWQELINSYVSSINKAIKLNKKNVFVPELGENLLWKDCLVAKAAREALDKIDKCADDFTIVFCINKDKYKLWDEMMAFD